MRKPDLGQIAQVAQIVVAAAVVLSLLYLGTEVRQNTVAIRAAAMQNVAATDAGVLMTLASNSGLARAVFSYYSWSLPAVWNGDEVLSTMATRINVQSSRSERPMTPPEAVRHALLALVHLILVDVRAYTAMGSRKEGLSAEHCRQLYRLADMSHNIPAFVEGTHPLGFDEQWLLSELAAFDRDYDSEFERVYREALQGKM